MRPAGPSERSFGLSVGTVCAAAGLFRLWRGHEPSGVALTAIGVALVAAGLAAPGVLRVPNRVWMRGARSLGWFNSRVLLTVFFYLVLTPVGFVMRLSGFSPFQTGSSTTNWSPYSAGRRDPKHFDRMF